MRNPQCSVPKKIWYSFIEPIKGREAESTLPSSGFEPGPVGRKRDTLPLENGLNNIVSSVKYAFALNSCRAASPLVRLVEEEEMWEASDNPQGVLPQNWDEIELNRSAK
ncbi:hypothetical protein TNCV_4573611 [Trichonephila clavipes]|nr:hypothetical protein TNCV_4573611 [Trichonephila clavipes]